MAQQQSPMSITQLVHSDEIINDIEDPDVQMAAQVLGDMARLSTVKKERITLPPLSAPSTTPSSPLPTPTTSSKERLSFSSDSTLDEEPRQQKRHFIHRVSTIPIVNSAIKVYENSKNSSYVMKYGAEKVESLVGPIYDKFAVDEWGCKQLDKLEERYPNYVNTTDDDDDDCKSTTFALSRASIMDDTTEGIRKRRDSRDETNYPVKSRSRNTSTSPHRPYTITKPTPTRHRQPLERSKWHQIVMHASSAAGTTAAVISEESMKCLKYCLNWLHYASQHIDQQMNLLKNFLVSLANNNNSSSLTTTTHDSTLNNIKKEIVNTLRKVVEVVSKYAGQGLPEQAKAAVRGFILALPSRWAILNSSTTASPVASPSLKPTNVQDTSIKLLNFGSESIEMINSVAHVFSDTIDRAELWLNRLRVVGVARQQQEPEQMDLN